MDYKKVHDAIIASWAGKKPLGYYEVHHIVPRCLGGGNEKENLVNLPPREHFIVHQLLAKMHGGHLIVAAYLMSKDGKHTNRTYAWLRKEYAKNRSQFMKGNKIMVGKKLSLETRRKLSLARIGNTSAKRGKTGVIPWNKGKKMPPESVMMGALKKTGQKRTVEQRQNMSLAQMGNNKGHGKLGVKTGKQKQPRSETHCQKLAEAARSRWQQRKLNT